MCLGKVTRVGLPLIPCGSDLFFLHIFTISYFSSSGAVTTVVPGNL